MTKQVMFAIEMLLAALAFSAAVAWGLSAMGKVSPPIVGWGGLGSEGQGFMKAFNRSARLNKLGAGFAGASAALSAISTLIGAL